ncbi:unnamed protein product [Caenorhabditis nigoni]
MLKIFGKVEDFDLETVEIDEDCIQTCFSDSNCILAFFNEISKCLLFFYNSTEFLEVVETTRDDGYFVAFKTNLTDPDPNYCPSGVKFPPRIIIDDQLIFWNKYQGGIWHYRKCKPFQRSNPKVTVCIQVFITRVGITQQEAKDYCSWIKWKLIGVANPEEAKWIFDKSMELAPDQKFYEGIWIDGERKTPGYDNFTWTDEYTEGYGALVAGTASLSKVDDDDIPENCLQVAKLEEELHGTAVINDIPCEVGTKTELGVACGLKVNL